MQLVYRLVGQWNIYVSQYMSVLSFPPTWYAECRGCSTLTPSINQEAAAKRIHQGQQSIIFLGNLIRVGCRSGDMLRPSLS